jgi:hypothetical protein
MKRVLFVLAVLILSASAAFADLTVTTSVSVKAGQMASDGTMTTFLKGTKALVDANLAGQQASVLSDAATRQQWLINHAAKQIQPYDPTQANAAIPITVGEAKASVKPNGQTKEILGSRCQGFDVEVVAPLTLGGETITLKLAGPAWVAKSGPGVEEFKASQKAFADAGLSVSMIAQGPQGKALSVAAKTLAESGVVLEQAFQISMEGTGQMAQMMGKMGAMTMTTKVTAISTDPIPDAKFALPEGYTKK